MSKGSKLRNSSLLTPKSELPWTARGAAIRIFVYYILIMALLLMLQVGLGQIFLEIFINTGFIRDENSPVLFANLIAAITGILGIGLTWIFIRIDERNFHQIGWFIPVEFVYLAIVAIIFTILALIVGLGLEILSQIIDLDQMLNDVITDPLILTFRTLFVIIGIGLGEEIMFRGYLQRVAESQLSFWKASTVTAFLFGFLHTFLLTTANPDGQGPLPTMIAVGVSAFIFGYVFSYAYKITGRSLYFPILLHGIWNSVIFFFNTEFHYDTTAKVILEIFSAFMAAMVFLGLMYYFQKNFSPQKELEAWN